MVSFFNYKLRLFVHILKFHKYSSLKIRLILFVLMNQSNQIRNGYVAKSNKGEKVSVSQYIKEVKEQSYLSYIDEELLKKLRNGFFHWSVNIGSTGMGPNIASVATADKRKRYIIPG